MKKLRILVVGDVMVDRYTFVSTSRDAMEASIPVWDEISNEYRLGGAANVAANLKSIGGDDVDVYLAGIVDVMSDPPIIPMFDDAGIDSMGCIGTSTMVKHRYVKDGTTDIIFRSDSSKSFSDRDVDALKMMLGTMLKNLKFDAVIVSDYDKGAVDKDVASMLTNVPVSVVDTKRKDVSIFSGMTLIKLNEFEYSAQVSSKLYKNFVSMFKYCVVTKGSKGADLIVPERTGNTHKYITHTESFPTDAVTAVDVTGCGDTHTASMAFYLAYGDDIRDAVRIANKQAARAVQKFGTAIV